MQAFGRTVLFFALATNLKPIIGLAIAQLMAKVIRRKGLLRTIIVES